MSDIFPDPILKVGDVVTFSCPAQLVRLCSFLGVHCDLHSVVKHGVTLCVVEKVEFHCLAGSGVHHPKVEPLCVALSVDVVLHHQIVFRIRYFLC